MRTAIAVFCFAAVVAVSQSALRAGVISMDLVSGSGDGLITYDDVYNREWLDLSQTLGRSYDDVASKLGSGQEFYGWSISSNEEVQQLAESAGINTHTLNYATNHQATADLLTYMPPTLHQGNTLYDVGWTNQDFFGSERWYSEILLNAPAGVAGYRPGHALDRAVSGFGVWLWRAPATQAVPEPSSLVSLALGTVGLIGVVRCRRQTASL